MWKLGPGLRPGATTLATVLRDNGYTANYIGKWHVAPNDAEKHQGLGFVRPEYRVGFLDLWQASNIIELTSHPYQGDIWDGSGKVMHFDGVYRIDYLTDLAVKFLDQKHDKPFLPVVSSSNLTSKTTYNVTFRPRSMRMSS